MVRWRGRKRKEEEKKIKKKKGKERAAPYSSKNFQTLNVQIFFRNTARRRRNACSKYDIHQVHLFSFTEFGEIFLVVQLG